MADWTVLNDELESGSQPKVRDGTSDLDPKYEPLRLFASQSFATRKGENLCEIEKNHGSRSR